MATALELTDGNMALMDAVRRSRKLLNRRALVGAALVGKFITRDLVIRMAQGMGRRLTIRQAAKYVPLAGQAVSAVMGYAALRYLGEEHIKDCVRVAQAAQL